MRVLSVVGEHLVAKSMARLAQLPVMLPKMPATAKGIWLDRVGGIDADTDDYLHLASLLYLVTEHIILRQKVDYKRCLVNAVISSVVALLRDARTEKEIRLAGLGTGF